MDHNDWEANCMPIEKLHLGSPFGGVAWISAIGNGATQLGPEVEVKPMISTNDEVHYFNPFHALCAALLSGAVIFGVSKWRGAHHPYARTE